MSLLDKATIITTPTAHSNGVLHSIKGGSVADFDVVRGSAATRVNAEGLIEDISILSGELVTNGDFSNGSTDWSLDTGWSVSDGKATSDGTNLAYLTQASIIFTGVSYKVQFDIVDYTSGSIKYRDNGLVGGQSFSGVGSYTDYVVAGGGQFRLMSENFIGSIDNISVVEVIDATNIPRLDYTGGTASILLEPQSTNLVLTSDSGTYGSIPSSEILETSPDGTINAVRPIPSSNSNRYQQAISAGTYSTGQKLTYSWYRKRISTPVIDTYVGDLSIQALVNVTAEVATQIQSNINGYDRFQTVIEITDGALSSIFRAYFGSAIGIGNSSVAYWGHQLEALPYATSYIPTSGAIATRLADSVTGAGDATTFNSTEGVLYAEINTLSQTGTFRQINLSNGTTSSRVYISKRASNDNLEFRMENPLGGLNFSFAVDTTGDFVKVAFRYGVNNFAVFINGVNKNVSPIGSTFPSGTLNDLQLSSSINQHFYGKVKSVITFNTALTDAELECLTTI